jgi:hypothetical protein
VRAAADGGGLAIIRDDSFRDLVLMMNTILMNDALASIAA